ncbi:MAG TPA: hypothetical protein VH482_32660 [Thermomicrobiales bacterium]
MRMLGKFGAEAWPIVMAGQGSRRVLLKVIVGCNHPLGHGRLNPSADQALYVHSRLTQVAAELIHPGHAERQSIAESDPARRHDEPAARLGRYGAEVWALTSRWERSRPELEVVLIESVHPDGHGVVRLTPEQTLYVRDRLEQISIAHLHENVWGGEDARRQ